MAADHFPIPNKILYYTIAAFGAATMVMQIINVVRLNLFWPFFLAIVMHLTAGILQFSRMVLLLPEKSE